MHLSPILLLHICAGTVSVFAGAAAMSYRKGGRRHAISGDVFVISMLTLGATGAYLGLSKHQILNGVMGLLTFYLASTAWRTAARRDDHTDIFDWAAFPVPLALAFTLFIFGVKAANAPDGILEGYEAPMYFVFGSLALLFGAGDIRMLARGGVSGARRIKRHLRRMSVAFFIAAASFFLGRQQIFPAAVRNSGILIFFSFLPLGLMLFWLIRLRLKKNAISFQQRATIA